MNSNIPTEIDYSGFLTALTNYQRGDNRFSDLDYEGSGISSILKLLASNTTSASLSAYFALNESFVSTSEILENVQALVTPESGYVPVGLTSSRIIATIVVTPPDPGVAPPTLTLSRAFTATGIGNGATYNFSPLSAQTVSLSGGVYTFSNVVMVEGQVVTNSFTQQGGAVSEFVIQNRDIDISTLNVEVRNSATDATTTTWTRFTTAFQLSATATVYLLSMNREGNYKLEFGDDRFFAALTDGNIVYATYVVSSGPASNGVPALTPTSQIGAFSDITITNQTPSSGGVDRESIESIKFRARTGFSLDSVATTTEQYTMVLQGLLPTHRVRAFSGDEAVPPRPGFVLFSTSPELSEPEQVITKAELDKVSVGSVLTDYVVSTVYTVTLDTFYVTDGSVNSNSQVGVEVTTVVDEYVRLNSLYGGAFEPNTLEELIRNISGVDRAYVSYTMTAPVEVSNNSITINYRRQIEPQTFVADITGSAVFDQIRETNDGFYQFLNGVQGTQIAVTTNYLSGVLSFILPDGVTVSGNTVSPAGDDMRIQVAGSELLTLVNGGIRV